jgi:predicted nucleic-acid-binding protein
MIFVDTNYFLSFLLSRENQQHDEAVRLFSKAADGKVKLATSIVVIFEIYWVLKSFYRSNREEIKRILTNILGMGFIEIQERKVVELAVANYTTFSFDLEDAYNVYWAQEMGLRGFKTFDKSLKRRIDKL